MSLSTHYLDGKEAISRRKIAFVQRLRQNFILKFISLATAVLLYFYVQQERNPTVPRVFEVPISFEGLPADVSIDSDQLPVKVIVTGPQPVVDVLKESELRVVADLKSLTGDKITTTKVSMRYEFKFPKEMQALLSFDPLPLPLLTVQVYPQRTREIAIDAHYPKESRAGYHYGSAVIKPEHIHISGRIDRIKRVVQVVADAKSIETGGGIDGYFSLSARDSENNPIEGITMSIQKAHVTVPSVEDPYSKIVSISPIINDLPLPSFRITHVTTDPKQVRIFGRPGLIDALSTLSTEQIPVKDAFESQALSVPLLIPRGLTVKDMNGNAITNITVRITIVRIGGSTPTTSGPQTSGPQ